MLLCARSRAGWLTYEDREGLLDHGVYDRCLMTFARSSIQLGQYSPLCYPFKNHASVPILSPMTSDPYPRYSTLSTLYLQHSKSSTL